MNRKLLFLLITVFAIATSGVAQNSAPSSMQRDQAAPMQRDQPSGRSQERIQKEVRHELLMLPWFGVFDNISYKVDGYNVTLYGQVVRPSLKSDAENVVKHIEGVEHVDNKIEVLTPSPMAIAWLLPEPSMRPDSLRVSLSAPVRIAAVNAPPP